MKKALRILLIASSSLLHSMSGHSQISIIGTYQVKKFVSYGQVQKDATGTGSWQKFPCLNCPVVLIKRDSINNIEKVFSIERRLKAKKDSSLAKLGAFITYTNTKGAFKCISREFKKGQEIYVLYGNSSAYKRRLKLVEKTNAGVYTQN